MKRTVAFSVLWTLAVWVPALVLAQTEGSNTFAPATGPAEEDVSGMMLMVSAYALLWVLLLAYVVRLGFLHAATARSLERVEKTLADGMARSEAQNDARTESDH